MGRLGTGVWVAGALLAAAAGPARGGAGVAVAPPPAYVGEPLVPLSEPIAFTARETIAWQDGETWTYLLKGEAVAVQGSRRMIADALVVWFDAAKARETGTVEVEIYGQGRVLFFLGDAVLERDEALIRWQTTGKLDVDARQRRRTERRAGDEVYLKAERARREAAKAAAAPPEAPLPPLRAQASISLFPVTARGFTQQSLPPRPGATQRVTTYTGGIDAVYTDPARQIEVEIAARNLVIWSTEAAGPDAAGATAPSGLEAYAEGDVAIFTPGGTMRADRLYYNFTTGQALIVHARAEAYSPAIHLPVIVEAERIRQYSLGLLTAQHARITTCDFGEPHYYVYCRRLTITEQTATDSHGEPLLDEAGRPRRVRLASAWDNALYIDGIPFFYWPYAEHDLADLRTGIRRARFRQDNNFGTQFMVDLDPLYFLEFALGKPPKGLETTLRLDELTKRGFAIGPEVDYQGTSDLGLVRSYFLHDSGTDVGGHEPPTRDRGRFLWRHHRDLTDDTLLKAEFSWISDEAFLNEYFEREFREEKDQETVVYLKKQRDLWAATFLTKLRVNDWQSETDYLPQVTLLAPGLPFMDDTLRVLSRSEAGVVRLARGDPERLDLAPLPESQRATIFRAETRDEVYRAITWWIFQVDPFVQGRAGFFGAQAGEFERVNGELERGELRDPVARASAAAGVRASTQFWRVYDLRNDFWNLDGLRHIITPEAAYFDLFALNVPSEDLVQFDEVDQVDLKRLIEFKLRQRLQTRRGVGENRQVIDWITADAKVQVYPNADRDNAGHTLGNVTGDLEYRLTDAVRLVGEARYDPALDNLKTASFGAGLDQSPRYSLFVGQRYVSVSDSYLLVVNLQYQLNEKWRADWLMQYDFTSGGATDYRIALDRDLHDFILRVGVRRDVTRRNTSVFVELTPKALPGLALRT
jgi:hypothetical protein